MKKRIIIIVSVIILLTLGGLYLFRSNIQNLIFNIQMKGINKDITIEEVTSNYGGYANVNYTYYIDLKKSKIYKTECQDVYGITTEASEKGKHFKIINSKTITDEEVSNIINIIESENNEIISEMDYYKVTYKDKEYSVLGINYQKLKIELVKILDEELYEQIK